MQFRYPYHPASFEIPDEWLEEAGVKLPAGRPSYRSTADSVLIDIQEIEPPFRNLGVPHDRDGMDRVRMVRLLEGVEADVELPPIQVARINVPDFPWSRFHFRVVDGFHRFHASIAAGFSALPCTFGARPSAAPTDDQAHIARAMAEDAIGYFHAARKVAENEPALSMLATYYKPANFLLGHCCELTLKSLLLTRGYSVSRLSRELSHDLDEAVDEAYVWGVPLEREFVRYCRIMAAAHRDSIFRFANQGSSHWVEPLNALAMIRPQLQKFGRL